MKKLRPEGSDLRGIQQTRPFDITTPPPESNGDLVQLGDVFTLTNAVEPPADLFEGDDDAECAMA